MAAPSPIRAGVRGTRPGERRERAAARRRGRHRGLVGLRPPGPARQEPGAPAGGGYDQGPRVVRSSRQRSLGQVASVACAAGGAVAGALGVAARGWRAPVLGLALRGLARLAGPGRLSITVGRRGPDVPRG